MRIRTLKYFAAVCLSVALAGWGAEKKSGGTLTPIAELKGHGPVDFAKEVQPILRKNCLACHGNLKPKAELDLENPPSIRKGGETGPCVIPGKGAESSLIKICSGQDEDSFMPPAKNNVGAKSLTSEQLGILKLWIDQGALGDANAGVEPLVWRPLPSGLNPIFAIDVTADGQTAACARANHIFMYNLPANQITARLADPALNKDGLGNAADRDYIQSLAFSPDGTMLASGGFRCVKLWREKPLSGKSEFNDPKAKSTAVNALAVHTGSHRIAEAMADGRVEIWNSEAGKMIWSLTGHTAAVNAVAFSADGTLLFSGSADKRIRVWNTANGDSAGEIFNPVAVTTLAYHDATQQIIVGGADNLIRYWRLPLHADYESLPAKELKGHGNAITALEFINGGKQLLSSAADGQMILWNFPDGQARKFDHGATVSAIAARPDGKRFATAGQNRVRVWNGENGQNLLENKGDRAAIDARSNIERDGAFYKSEQEYHKAALQNSEKDQKSALEAVKKAGEAKIAATKDADAKVESLKKAIAEKDAAKKIADEPTEALKKATEAKDIATKSATDSAAELKTAAEKAVTAKKAFDKSAESRNAAEKALNDLKAKADSKDAGAKPAPDAIKAAQAQFDSAKLAFERDMATQASAEKIAQELDAKAKAAATAKGATEKTFNELTAKSADATTKFKTAEKAFTDADQANSNAKVAKEVADRTEERAEALVKKADSDMTFHKTSLAEFEALQKQNDAKLEAAKKAVTDSEKTLRALAVSPLGTMLAGAGDGGLISIWGSEAGRAGQRFSIQAAGAPAVQVNALKFLDDNRLLIGSTTGCSVWNVNHDWVLERVVGTNGDDSIFGGRILALQFSPDGKALAVGGGVPSRSGEVKIINPENGALLREFKDAHSDSIFGVAYSADGKMLATCGADKFIRVFDLGSGKLIKTFEGHTHHVLGVSWKRDGRLLASSGADKTIKVWDMVTGEQKLNLENRFKKEVTSIHYLSGQANFLVSGGEGNVRILKDENGNDVKGLGNDKGFLQSAAISADGRTVLAGGDNSTLYVFDGNDGKLLNSFDPPK